MGPRPSKRRGQPKPGKRAARPNGRIRDAAPLLRAVPNVDHKFVRTYDYGNLLAVAADSGYAFGFTFDNLPNYTEFTALYDFYRIDMIEVTWELIATASTVTKTSAIMPIVIAWPDYDDTTAPASLAVSDQVGQIERLNLSEARPSVKRAIRPHVALTSGILGPSVVSPFIDMTAANITHFGIKFWVKNFNTTTQQETGATLTVSFRYHFTCRNPR